MQALLEGLAQRGALTSAACCLLVVDCLEGSASAQRLTLSLLQVSSGSGCSKIRVSKQASSHPHEPHGSSIVVSGPAPVLCSQSQCKGRSGTRSYSCIAS